MGKAFHFEVEGVDREISRKDLPELLKAVASEESQFIIVTHQASGWFMQAAGAYRSLTVEFQRQSQFEERQHFRVCRSDLGARGELRRPPMVEGYEGYLEKEVLSVEDALTLFHHFLDAREVAQGFDTTDITGEVFG